MIQVPEREWDEIKSVMNYQKDADQWAREAFGDEVVDSVPERTMRFCEESLELVQSCGLTKDQAQVILDRVYSRPPDPVPEKEVGGVGVTLAVLCNTFGFSMYKCFLEGLEYCWKNMEKIRASHARKQSEGISVK